MSRLAVEQKAGERYPETVVVTHTPVPPHLHTNRLISHLEGCLWNSVLAARYVRLLPGCVVVYIRGYAVVYIYTVYVYIRVCLPVLLKGRWSTGAARTASWGSHTWIATKHTKTKRRHKTPTATKCMLLPPALLSTQHNSIPCISKIASPFDTPT